MVIETASPLLFSPDISLLADPVVDSAGTTSPAVHRQFDYSDVTNASYHNDYLATGSNSEGDLSFASIPANTIDFSEWPRIKRVTPMSDPVYANVSNGRGTQRIGPFVFSDIVGGTYKGGPASPVVGSYAEYALERVLEITEATPDSRIFENSGSLNRVNLATFPHQAFTGMCWKGGWASSVMVGYRPVLVTPRVCVNAGHYGGNPVGQTWRWKDADNVVHSSTVLAMLNLKQEAITAGCPFPQYHDFALYLMSSDLPAEITPMPIAGPWAYPVISEDASSIISCSQGYGIQAWGNDGTYSPFVLGGYEDRTYIKSTLNDITVDGVLLSVDQYQQYGWRYQSETKWAEHGQSGYGVNLENGKFHHNRRSGDSGSPFVIPVTGGWAFYTLDSSGISPTESVFNSLIGILETRAGLDPGDAGTVTVATDPTL